MYVPLSCTVNGSEDIMQQGRWVSYIFAYRNGVRSDNAGFIKVQRLACRNGEMARVQIGLRMMKERACRCQVYMLFHENKVKYLTDMEFKAKERDTIIKRVEISWDRPFDDVIPFNAYDGLFFVCDDGEILAGLWHEQELDISKVTVACNSLSAKELSNEAKPSRKEYETEKPDNKEHETGKSDGREYETGKPDNKKSETEKSDGMVPEMNHADVQKAQIVYEDKPEPESGYDGMTACREMLATYPKLPLMADSQFLECVKIVPQDIGKLSMGNWKLGVNSFLSHGYYHYRYIMLGKVKFDKNEIYVIGVPGVFTNKERYLANMFGFNLFIPAKKTKFLMGNFGYWISEISSE